MGFSLYSFGCFGKFLSSIFSFEKIANRKPVLMLNFFVQYLVPNGFYLGDLTSLS